MSNNIALAAQTAARCLFDAAQQGDAALGEARAAILKVAAGHVAFFELLIGELALAGIEHHGREASDYYAAEITARLTLTRFLPELARPCLDCGSA
jgi:hypothetical protein